MANKETALAQPLGGWSKQNRMLGEEEVSSDASSPFRADMMKQAARSDMLNLSR